MPGEMTEPCCPHLVCEKTALRASLDLSAATAVSIIVTWYCRHPFHGMPLDLSQYAEKRRGSTRSAHSHGQRRSMTRKSTASRREAHVRRDATPNEIRRALER